MSTPTTWDADVPVALSARPSDVLLAAGLLGCAFQLLFWGTGLGLSFPTFVVLLLSAVWWVGRRHDIALAGSSVAITAAAVVLAAGVAVRAEPLTTAVNVVVVVGLLAVLVHTFGSDRWLRYGLRDWLLAALRLAGHEVTGAPAAIMAQQRSAAETRRWRRLMPLLRGLAIAGPLVVLLASLLVSADSVFAAKLDRWTPSLPRFDEAVGRLVLASLAAYAVAGGLWHLLQRRAGAIIADVAVPKVLGFTEAAIVLGSVNALFAGFVAVQLRYFFGGRDGLVAGGLNYADYARRGFGELVVVAAVSLCVHLVLAGLTRRHTRRQRWAFSLLTGTLTTLVVVILISAFQRLVLYEEAFGFTRLRTVVHVFMVWLGLLLVVLVALELAGRVRLFLLASVLAVVGFALTLDVVGVDALIARHNVARAVHGAQLDVAYLQGLSTDAVPELAAALPTLDPPLAEQVIDLLACFEGRIPQGDWRALRLADVRARAALPTVAEARCLP